MDGKFENLPKWAQQEITRLKSEIKGYKRQADQVLGKESTDVYITDLQDLKPLPQKSTIVFTFGKEWYEKITVRKVGDTIDISADGLTVFPVASNRVNIKLGR